MRWPVWQPQAGNCKNATIIGENNAAAPRLGVVTDGMVTTTAGGSGCEGTDVGGRGRDQAGGGGSAMARGGREQNQTPARVRARSRAEATAELGSGSPWRSEPRLRSRSNLWSRPEPERRPGLRPGAATRARQAAAVAVKPMVAVPGATSHIAVTTAAPDRSASPRARRCRRSGCRFR